MSNLRFRVVLGALVLASPAVAVAGDDLATNFIDKEGRRVDLSVSPLAK